MTEDTEEAADLLVALEVASPFLVVTEVTDTLSADSMVVTELTDSLALRVVLLVTELSITEAVLFEVSSPSSEVTEESAALLT